MRIGFDAKRAMLNYTGLGNYSRFVIKTLSSFYPEHTYHLFCPRIGAERALSEISIEDRSIEVVIKANNKPFWRTLGIVNDIKKQSIDLYHGLSNELPYGINKQGVKSIVTIHDLIFLKYPHFYPLLERNIYNQKARYSCKIADKIIAVSECTKRDIVEFYNIDPNKIEVVYQGCSTTFTEKANIEERLSILDKYHLPSNFILSVGSIEDRKNILQVVKALEYLPDLHFVAIGRRRKYAEKVLEYAEKNNLADRVHLIHDIPQADLPAIMQSAQIFTYPSLYEGFGIPIIEALSSGIPVIAATGSCLEEAGGPHSIYVDPMDEKELAKEIKRVLNDKDLRLEMIVHGYEYVKKFEESKCAENMMSVYKKLI